MSDIPIIDIGPLLKGGPELETGKQIRQALHEFGFFYIVNHGVEDVVIKELHKLSDSFFKQSETDKMQYKMENRGRAWRGYFPVGLEYTAGVIDQKEGLYFGTEHESDHEEVRKKSPMHGANQWPNPQMKNIVSIYMKEMTKLSELLLATIAVQLGLEKQYFARRFLGEPTKLFRIFCYPPSEQQYEWGVGEHTDMGFLTILLQDQLGGLQIKTSRGWIDAPPIENSFIVNIGDMLELWTWGVLKATLHRVKNAAARNRYSFPFFYDPSWNASLERIPKELLNENLLIANESSAEQRWDALDLHKLDERTTYGEFVWSKIEKVFPHLANLDA